MTSLFEKSIFTFLRLHPSTGDVGLNLVLLAEALPGLWRVVLLLRAVVNFELPSLLFYESFSEPGLDCRLSLFYVVYLNDY